MIKLLMMFLVTTNIYAATVWTQEGRFFTYNTTPNKPKQTLVRVPIGQPDDIQAGWVKVGEEWIKERSSGGAVRYVAAPLPDECVAKFTCSTKWGWIVNLSYVNLLKCPAIKIKNEQIVQYDNATIDKDCPTYLK